MSDYTPATNFTTKDGLASGDPEKTILGADVDAEFTAIQTAVASKLDNPSTDALKAAIALPGVVGFHATPSGDQASVATGTNTKVLFATETYDFGADFASSTFTAPDTGIYIVTACVQTLTIISDGLSCQAWFLRNGTTELSAVRETTGVANTVILNLTWIGRLTAGQTMDVYFRHNLGSDVTLDSVGTFGQMSFSGARLS